MRIDLKDVKRCKNDAYGNFLLRGTKSALITISLALNKRIDEYAATVLHELLHLWVTILRLKGFVTTNRREHDFIYAVERVILQKARRHLRRKTHGYHR
jgi:hypothetical protein